LNSRLDEAQAAILSTRLNSLKRFNDGDRKSPVNILQKLTTRGLNS